MKRLAISVCVILFALVVAAPAQDNKDLSGFYVGANVGGAFGSQEVDTSPIFSPTGYFASSSTPAITTASHHEMTPKGFVGGGTIGYNHVWDNDFFFGIEGDFGFMKLSDTTSVTAPYPCCAPTSFTVTQKADTNWLITVRPRMGFILHHAAVYGTVGPAFTNVEYSGLLTDTFATAHETATIDENRVGYAAGGGVEVPVLHHWSVKGEYLYTDFGSATVPSTNLTAFTPAIAFPSNVFTHTVTVKAQIVRFGVNYRF